jgi:hypothetical protein
MAQKESLSCLAKRDLLNQSAVSLENLISWGNHYEQLGLLHDAVNFYEKAKATDALGELLKIAQEEGDTFLFKRINRILNREPDRQEWLALANQAERLGKEAFAAEAFRQVNTEEGAPEQSSAKS